MPSRHAEEVERKYRIMVDIAVYRKGRNYRAVCLDFGLIVERPTLSEAVNELTGVLRGYFDDAYDAGIAPEDMRRLVPQRERRYVYRQLLKEALKQYLASLFRAGRD